MKEKTFNKMRNAMLYHRIIEWEDNTITLDNGMQLTIEETDQDCCASASGTFTNVVLDAAITDVSNIEYEPYDWREDGDSIDTYGCKAKVTIMHNQNIICQAEADADAGNGGYYYSIASFIVRPAQGQPYKVHFVESSDGRN